MRVLMVHGYYQQFGGEDMVFDAEGALLESHGHTVERFTFDNHEIESWSSAKKAASLFWNRDARSRVRDLIRSFAPDVMHVQNTFPGLSPSVYAAANEAGVPIVQKLCNYRLLCANGMLFRDGHHCEDCLGKRIAWPAVAHKCFRDHRVMSGAIAGAYGLHRALGTWTRRIGAFLALDEGGRELFIKGGLPADRVLVKPNFLDPFPAQGSGEGNYALFAGRVAPGKGVETLVRAWANDPSLPGLKVVGDGPLLNQVKSLAGEASHIEFLGRVSPNEVSTLMGSAAIQVVPSESREPFGRVALEAMGTGTPVLSTRSGALEGLIRPGENGEHFDAGDPTDLVAKARSLLGIAAGLRTQTRENAMQRFSGAANHAALMHAYRVASAHAAAADA